jgi:hypothetical protein
LDLQHDAHRLVEIVDASIMEVRLRQFDVAQRRRLEAPAIAFGARDVVAALVGVGDGFAGITARLNLLERLGEDGGRVELGDDLVPGFRRHLDRIERACIWVSGNAASSFVGSAGLVPAIV